MWLNVITAEIYFNSVPMAQKVIFMQVALYDLSMMSEVNAYGLSEYLFDFQNALKWIGS